jgi:hypothetical protein
MITTEAYTEDEDEIGGEHTVRVYNIEWDDATEEDIELDGLPDEVEIDVPIGMNLDTELADELTDQYGWCIRSLEYQIL